MIHTRNTLPEPIRQRSVDILAPSLAAAIDLHAQLRHAHWNVRGPNFAAVHALFAKVAGVVADATDEIAERIGALGGTAHGTVPSVAQRSTLLPYPVEIADEVQHLAAVAAALACYADMLRQGIAASDQGGDDVSADLFTAVARSIDHQLWLVESHLYRG